MTVLESIIQSIRNAASYNEHELAPPRVILWPDEERLRNINMDEQDGQDGRNNAKIELKRFLSCKSCLSMFIKE